MTNSEASADAEISAQGEDKKDKKEKKTPMVTTHTLKGYIEDIETKTTSTGNLYQAVYIGGKVISNFEVDLSEYNPGDFVEITYKQKGVYANLVKIRLLSNEQNAQNQLPFGQNNGEQKRLLASVKFAENFSERISFRDGLVHTVKLLGDEEAEIIDTDGTPKRGIRCFVEEDGKKKDFFTTSKQLILALSKFYIGDVITIQLKHKNVAGRVRSFYEISKISK